MTFSFNLYFNEKVNALEYHPWKRMIPMVSILKVSVDTPVCSYFAHISAVFSTDGGATLNSICTYALRNAPHGLNVRGHLNIPTVIGTFCFHQMLLATTWLKGFPTLIHRSISEVKHGWWVIRSGSQSAAQFIPKVLDGVEVRDRSRQVKFFHLKLGDEGTGWRCILVWRLKPVHILLAIRSVW